MSSSFSPSLQQQPQKRFVRFGEGGARVFTGGTCAVWGICLGRVGRCGWNCMCGAFSARIKHVYARSSTPRLPSVVAPYARRTTRLTDLFTLIGFALGGEAGKRLVDGMGLEISPDTLLRLIREQQERQVPTPRVLGVDDFSFCRRRSYGAILIDLERRVPIDLLPDREAETFKKWLLAHQGVQIISRDRGGAFADGARQGAPQAQQIADRWHRLSNLSETMKGFFLNKQAQLKALVQKPPEDLCEEEAKQLAPWQTSMRKHLEAKSLQLHQERVTRYEQIHDLSAKKVDVTAIARQVGVSRQCVYEYVRLQQPPERTHIPPARQPILEPYKAYLVRRWNEGCRNAQQAYREVKEQGYPGTDNNSVRFFGHLRKHFNQAGTFKQVDPATQTPVQVPPRRPPSASQVAHWITFKEEQRLDWQKKYLAQLCEADQEIRETYELITDFTTISSAFQNRFKHIDCCILMPLLTLERSVRRRCRSLADANERNQCSKSCSCCRDKEPCVKATELCRHRWCCRCTQS